VSACTIRRLASNVLGFYVQFFATLNLFIALQNVRKIEHKILLNEAVPLRSVIRTFYFIFLFIFYITQGLRTQSAAKILDFYHLQNFWRHFFFAKGHSNPVDLFYKELKRVISM